MRKMMWTVKVKPGKLEETIAAGKAHIAAAGWSPDASASISMSMLTGVTPLYLSKNSKIRRRWTRIGRHRISCVRPRRTGSKSKSLSMEWLDPPDEVNPSHDGVNVRAAVRVATAKKPPTSRWG